jgi:chromatin segregation and condensation protein Rec8/ScpA/Scc1 (kleisin family)
MAKPKTGSERFRMQIEDQARVAAETLQRNSELSQHVSELEEQLEVERANMQQSIDFERSEREQLEVRLQEERDAREKMVEEERRSRLEFEKIMMAKFNQQMAKFSQQMGNQQVITVICFLPCKVYFANLSC